jgi:ATP-dependent RNA helicase DeaD
VVSTEPRDADDLVDDGFEALGLDSALLAQLSRLGYEEPTPIQREAIPVLLGGADLLGQAATGTGKTAAFALPILQQIGRDARPVPTALVLVPTRELAVQVSEAMFKYGRDLRIKVLPVFGGQPIQRQLKELSRGVHVVVATPGRAIDHIKRRSLDLDSITTVVLDEADEMLDMGFTEDIEAILEETPEERQTVLFSATIPKRIASIAKRYQRDPVRIELGKGSSDSDETLVRQTVYWVQRNHKASALGRILDIEVPTSTIVFCRTRTEVDELTATMNGRGYRAEAIHGGMDQNQRDRVMARLRDGSAELLVATDVAARGLDVDTLTHVVNYDVPSAPESYVHRIGRVGRAGREGVAITLAEPRQRRLLGNIERFIKQPIEVSKIPTVADLRSKQIELTVEALNEALASDDLDDYQSVLHELAGEDQRRIALAAIKLVHEARATPQDEREIPDASHDRKKDKQGRGGSGKPKGRPGSSGKPGKGRPSGGGDTGFVYVNAGKKVGVRPADLVGAIANESGLAGRDIGPIRISEHHSVVGVPEASVDDVVRAMNSATVRGKPAKVRRYVD